jgi:predicted phosphoribosyltransferase
MLQPFRAPSQHRQEAGRELAHRLLAYKGQPKVLVLSVSRGGVLVAAGIADVLEAPSTSFSSGA